EGDAVFAIGADGALPDGSVLPALLADAFGVFKEEQRRMAGDESCAWRACRDIPKLDLKVVVHHGHFARQTVGGRARVAGPDAIAGAYGATGAIVGPPRARTAAHASRYCPPSLTACPRRNTPDHLLEDAGALPRSRG